MSIIGIIASISLAILSVAIVYLYFLSIIGLLGNKSYPDVTKNYDFLIIIPAHNESSNIRRLLESISSLVSQGRLEITVVADNCTDNTVSIARGYNVTVLKKDDGVKINKWHAINWAINQYDLERFNAVVIIDANCVVERGLLRAIAESIEGGADAVQVCSIISKSQKLRFSFLSEVTTQIDSLFFYRGRAILGLPVLLRGNAMAIRTEVLEDYPLDSLDQNDDLKYTLSLFAAHKIIDYNSNSFVMESDLTSYSQSKVSKSGFIKKTLNTINDRLIPICKMGMARKRLDLVELGISFLLKSRLLLFITDCIALILSLFAPSGIKKVLVSSAIFLMFLQVSYLFIGLIFMTKKGRSRNMQV
jgi:cellulose synthase/poly-beta-1,6-N-acetylglucosamine synthase-like glycosyltransferase